jgi:hypothetical protein
MRKLFVTRPSSYVAEVIPGLVKGVGAGAKVVRFVVNATDVPRVAAVAAAHVLRCSFEKQNSGAQIACSQRAYDGRVSTADYDHVPRFRSPIWRGLEVLTRFIGYRASGSKGPICRSRVWFQSCSRENAPVTAGIVAVHRSLISGCRSCGWATGVRYCRGRARRVAAASGARVLCYLTSTSLLSFGALLPYPRSLPTLDGHR